MDWDDFFDATRVVLVGLLLLVALIAVIQGATFSWRTLEERHPDKTVCK